MVTKSNPTADAAATAAALASENGSTATSETSVLAGDESVGSTKPKITTLREGTVVIQRNPMTKVPTIAYLHELPLLQRVHGEDNVELTEQWDVEVENFDVGAEYDRLKRKYNRKGGEEVVQLIFGHTPNRLADDLGVRYSPTEKSTKTVKSQQSGSAKPTKPRKAK